MPENPGGDMNAITPRECEKCHEGITENQNRAERRMNAHSDAINEISKLNDRALTLIENQGKMIEAQGKTMEKITERLEAVEQDQVGVKTAQDIVQAFVSKLDDIALSNKQAVEMAAPNKTQAADVLNEAIKAPWFSWLIKGLVIGGLLILGAALGKSMGLDLTDLFK